MDENEKSSSTGTNSVDIVICIGRISRYIERKYIERFRKRFTGA